MVHPGGSKNSWSDWTVKPLLRLGRRPGGLGHSPIIEGPPWWLQKQLVRLDQLFL